MTEESNEPHTPPLPTPTIRHDGWTGDKMATFLETLAETAVVAEACDQARMGMSGAYALRRRNPAFAAAWDAALTIARERLADTLLARSMEGNVEQIYRDGELIGERHLLDNRLGLAILRRLDRLAEMGIAVSTIGQRVTLRHNPRHIPACHPHPVDWLAALDALRSGDDAGVARALALVEGNEVEEVEGPPNPGSEGGTRAGMPGACRACGSEAGSEDDGLDLTDRCWLDGIDEIWMTDFPPPPGFAGYESRPYDADDPDEPYTRACTAEEIAILTADVARSRAAERAEDEELRDEWFKLLKDEAGGDPPTGA